MSNDRHTGTPDDSFPDDSNSDELDELQQLIRRAGDYLTVTDDLRPRVLERARERDQQRRSVVTLAIALVLLLSFGFGLRTVSIHWKLSSKLLTEQVWADDRQQQSAVDEAALAPVDETPAWTLAKVFAELRMRRARLLGAAL